MSIQQSMVAFSCQTAGVIKVYEHGNDLQAVLGDTERWYSMWSADRASAIRRAASGVAMACGVDLALDDLVLV